MSCEVDQKDVQTRFLSITLLDCLKNKGSPMSGTEPWRIGTHRDTP